MQDRVTQIQSALEVIATSGEALLPKLERDGGRTLFRQPDQVAEALSARLVALCRTRAVADVLGGALPAGLADVVMVWAESAGARDDIVLAPLIAGTRATARPIYRQRAAAARVLAGPLFDAIHCIPATWEVLGGDLERRVRQLVWETGARGLTLPGLGTWAWNTPGVVRALVIDPARGHLGDRVRAARGLATLADGFSEDSSPGLARVVLGVAQRLFLHPEPMVWRDAARALGRMALGSVSARMAVFRGSADPRLHVRRRSIAAIGSLSPELGADAWIEQQVHTALSDEARRADPWQLPAFAIATPHLARERPELWERLCGVALARPSLELAWSLAQGLATLARHSGGRGWIAEEKRVATALHAQLEALPLDQPTEVARRLEALVCLDRALGKTPVLPLRHDILDARIRARIDNRTDLPTLPALEADLDLDALDRGDAEDRGRAIAVLRSATRTYALQLPSLAGEPEMATEDDRVISACARRLAADHGEYATRVTLLGAITDVVASHVPGAGAGRAAASALHALAGSRWIRDVAREGETGKLAREIARFRKPLEDLFATCLVGDPNPGDVTVPPVVAAWWALCAGPAASLGWIERPRKSAAGASSDDGAELRARIAELEAALALGASAPVAAWGTRAIAALCSLSASDTALVDVFTRLVEELARAERVTDRAAAVGQADSVRAAARAILAVGGDLDDAVAPGTSAGPGSGVPLPSWLSSSARERMAEGSAVHALGSHPPGSGRQLVPALAAIVDPVLARLNALATRPTRFEPRAGATFGKYRLVERLGSGGMGEVWRAQRGNQPVALKLVRTDVSDEDRLRLAAILEAEADVVGRLAFARVVVLLEFGVHEDMPYLVTSYVRGRTLYDHLIVDPDADAGGKHLPLTRRIVHDICIGLDNLHCHGLVHRDLKPTNVMLRVRGVETDPIRSIRSDPRGNEIDEAVLIDFGIAHAFHLGGYRGGTAGYAAPETIAGEPVGPAADMYAFGATTFHLLTRRPLTGERPLAAAMVWHLRSEPSDDPDVKAALKRLPKRLANAIAGAVRLVPDERISLAEFRREFEA